MEKQFQFLEHPADIGIEASGRNLTEVFENAAYGFYELILDTPINEPVLLKNFEIEAIDTEALLVRFLSELLYLFEVDEFIGINIHVLSIVQNQTGFILKAELQGIQFNKQIHNFKIGVKAVTFHQLEITHKTDHYMARVFFDI